MLVAPPGRGAGAAGLLRRGAGRGRRPAARAPLVPVDVSFGDAVQVFHIGAASAGAYGTPSGICAASQRFGTRAAGRARRARRGAGARRASRSTAEQAYVFEILLADRRRSTPEARALFLPEGRPLARRRHARATRTLGDALERLGGRGRRAVLHRATSPRRVCALGGRARRRCSAPDDLAGYAHLRARRRSASTTAAATVLTNPPPSAGGMLHRLRAGAARRGRPAPPSVDGARRRDGAAQAERTPEFLEGLAAPGFLERFLRRRLGATTHISVLDDERLGVLGDVHERRGLRRGRPRHRHPPQQHDGRAGPLPARLLHAIRRGAGCRR